MDLMRPGREKANESDEESEAGNSEDPNKKPKKAKAKRPKKVIDPLSAEGQALEKKKQFKRVISGSGSYVMLFTPFSQGSGVWPRNPARSWVNWTNMGAKRLGVYMCLVFVQDTKQLLKTKAEWLHGIANESGPHTSLAFMPLRFEEGLGKPTGISNGLKKYDELKKGIQDFSNETFLFPFRTLRTTLKAQRLL